MLVELASRYEQAPKFTEGFDRADSARLRRGEEREGRRADQWRAGCADRARRRAQSVCGDGEPGTGTDRRAVEGRYRRLKPAISADCVFTGATRAGLKRLRPPAADFRGVLKCHPGSAQRMLFVVRSHCRQTADPSTPVAQHQRAYAPAEKLGSGCVTTKSSAYKRPK